MLDWTCFNYFCIQLISLHCGKVDTSIQLRRSLMGNLSCLDQLSMLLHISNNVGNKNVGETSVLFKIRPLPFYFQVWSHNGWGLELAHLAPLERASAPGCGFWHWMYSLLACLYKSATSSQLPSSFAKAAAASMCFAAVQCLVIVLR